MVTWTPTVDQVKGLIPQRVAGGPFSTTSVPTSAQVAQLATQITAEVLAEVGTIPEAIQDMANWVSTLGTAAYVELGFFPEQQDESGGTGAILYQRYMDGLKRLQGAVAGQGGDLAATANLRSAVVMGGTLAAAVAQGYVLPVYPLP